MKWYIFVANQRVIFFYKWLHVVFKKMLKCHEFELHWETILKPGLCIMTQQLKERWKAFLFDIIVILALRNDDLMIT